ncbi:DNA-processing protein DprA [Pseudidiomarina taiwanensis]|uniref:DNA-protecting protein DprA n=1 Tax=Pseudidiomarina taiwanensis TaxID=337250 RepID=A0A432ZER8_9GAMM|nr:DNA-processing protein DprA [Pseudidiomarina taiwanensis]RUO76394.1 DNA-protecting protein DprA [Pseudidiomarina taiwanensis]
MDAATLELQLRMATAPAKLQQHLLQLSSHQAIEHALAESHRLSAYRPIHLHQAQQWLRHPAAKVVDFLDPEYPPALQQIDRPPPVLFIQGDRELLTQPQLALVGSRNASALGCHNAAYFAEGLAQAGMVVSSGLAQGIDAAAHRAALDVGTTLAVLGTGPDQFYPPRHRGLQEQIIDQGLIVSEWIPGTGARRDHFPRRNRLLSALALGVLVIEAKQRSGSLITARFALEQNKTVFSLPGSIWDAGIAGNLQLLQQGASLVTCVKEILTELNLTPTTPISCGEDKNKSIDSLANVGLLANVDYEVTSIDTIVKRSGLPVAAITEQLVLLELEGKVTSVTGGYIKMGRR